MSKFARCFRITLITVLCLTFSLLFAACGEPGEKGDKGDKGDTGVAGVGIVSISKSGNAGNVDIYTITKTDNSTTTFTVTNGVNGQDGKDGEDGVSVTNAQLIDGELVLSFSKGNPINLGNVVGQPGEKGDSLENIVLDNDGVLSVTYAGQTTTLGNVKGAAGQSAYELYKQYNPEYTGDESQWIDDLCNGRLNGDKTIIISFDSNGGSQVDQQVLADDSRISRPQDPVLDGYDFEGWYLDGEKWSFLNHVAVNDMTLVAQWTKQKATLTFDENGGKNVKDQKEEWGTTVQLETPSRNGYYFDGWKDSKGQYHFESYTIPQGGDNLVAQWTQIPGDNYNYYGIKYEFEDEVKIQPITFQGIYKMFTTAGKFVLYIDSETTYATKANMQAVNKLANDWNITIYHFNPDLSGGYGTWISNSVNANIITDLTGIAAQSQLKLVQDLLISISGKNLSFWQNTDGQLLGISGAESTVNSNGALKYNGKISAANSIEYGAKSIAAVAQKRPSFGSYTDEPQDVPYVPQAYITTGINTINLFADARFHMYNDDNGTHAYTAQKTDVYQTVANYMQLAHLMDNNDGKFLVLFGGTFCPNTQAVAKLTDQIAKQYGVEKIYFFNPRLDDGVRLDAVSVSSTFSFDKYMEDSIKADNAATPEAAEAIMANAGYTTIYSVVENNTYLASNLNTRNNDGTGVSYNYNYLYGSFLSEYLNTYVSEWNIGVRLTITVGNQTSYYTRLPYPTLLLFDGSDDDRAAKLVGLAEAEYNYQNTSVPGNPQNVAWTEAVCNVFDYYWCKLYDDVQQDVAAAPPVVVTPGAGSSSSAGAGADAC